MKKNVKKLTLNRETLRFLEGQLDQVHGGWTEFTCQNSCNSTPRSRCDTCQQECSLFNC